MRGTTLKFCGGLCRVCTKLYVGLHRVDMCTPPPHVDTWPNACQTSRFDLTPTMVKYPCLNFCRGGECVHAAYTPTQRTEQCNPTTSWLRLEPSDYDNAPCSRTQPVHITTRCNLLYDIRSKCHRSWCTFWHTSSLARVGKGSSQEHG